MSSMRPYRIILALNFLWFKEVLSTSILILIYNIFSKGDPGATGATGAKGAAGKDGLSAHELAVQQGFTGTLDEWLASLKAPN
ncbi:hypothetical protein U0534_00530 [Bacillus atrophaeus]|uniref:hypothetical protein n=1 Tax=Bacillus atrophaeus TaxID=1452 RepID=UPI000557A3C9|nr:hypothetical protein [Bacillus atrophaeus]MEC1727696.1 hypothetical protein [Bacillus atrophaeus]WQP44647.1 hypothetical protein U0534_00530 [Bacillus atrophaeus]